MDQPGEFVSEPFDFSGGGVLCVEASISPQTGWEPVEYTLEGSDDKALWAQLMAGTVRAGETVVVPCRGHTAPWGRVRLRSFGGGARVSVRGFGKGKR